MIRLGPVTIMRTSTAKAYSEVTRAAWVVHMLIWFDQKHDYSALVASDSVLADRLSRTPQEDVPT